MFNRSVASGPGAEELMRKPAERQISEGLVHSINLMDDKTLKSMRELQRRWRNTVRISRSCLHRMSYWIEQFLTTMESILCGWDGPIKRTCRVVVNPHFMVRRSTISDTLIIPVGQLAEPRLD